MKKSTAAMICIIGLISWLPIHSQAVWNIETVDSGGDVGWYCSIVINADQPHIVYYDPTNTNLKYATKSGTTWQTATIDKVELDIHMLSKLIARIQADKYKNIHSILIVKNGKLVLEEYFDGHRFLYSADDCKGEFIKFGKDTLHHTLSVTKIITSTIIGVAINKGFIKNCELCCKD